MWPPEYIIKTHPRAKYVKLRVHKEQGLIVTIPTRFNKNELPHILEKHKSWILKKLTYLYTPERVNLPTQIDLSAMHEHWLVQYQPSDINLKMIERPTRELILLGRITDQALCLRKLHHWIKHKAKSCLPLMLNNLSAKTKLEFTQLTIRDQRTLWGSCNSKKSISLNYKLIFLQPNLVEHIIIHELCHTKYLNHSTKFWNLVSQFDTQWQSHRTAMRQADKYIPTWVK